MLTLYPRSNSLVLVVLGVHVALPSLPYFTLPGPFERRVRSPEHTALSCLYITLSEAGLHIRWQCQAFSLLA